jgi:hypothetical protein
MNHRLESESFACEKHVMYSSILSGQTRSPAKRQGGVTTLTVAMLLLAIVTIIVLFSSNVGFFEQRIATGENRARLGEQSAEYSLSITGEWIKTNLDVIVRRGSTGNGWMSTTTHRRWARCTDAADEIAKDYVHPCEILIGSNPALIGADAANLYFYARGGVASANADIRVADVVGNNIHNLTADPLFPDNLLEMASESNQTFVVSPYVQAVLCRIDTTIPDSPTCSLDPQVGNNIAVTLISSAAMGGEATEAVVMETWSTYSELTPGSTVPLVASGVVKGLGNADIVAAPNAGGFGLAASIWSACAVSISGTAVQPDDCEKTTGGIGSVATCHLSGYLGDVPLDELLTTCAEGQNCACPGTKDHRDVLSGHFQSDKLKRHDVLDRDLDPGNPNPNITFFPGRGHDDENDPTDDNLFEWIFGLDYVSKSLDGKSMEGNNAKGATAKDCGDDKKEDCAVWALKNDLGAELVTCEQLNVLAENASGLYYVTDSADAECELPAKLGSPDASVIVVVDKYIKLNGGVVFGMLFVRDPADKAVFEGAGNSKVFGAIVVEGEVDIKGNFELVYVDWAAQGNTPDKPPPARNFGRVGGSWLDGSRGF